VEYQFPYAWPAGEIARCAGEAGVEIVLHNLPAGDFAKGDRGIACLPGREREFRDGVERAIDYAKAAGCPRLNCLAGLAPAGREHFAVLVDNVRFAARKLGAAGLSLTLEPINTRTVPGFFLSRSAQAIDVLNAACSPASATCSSPTCPGATSRAAARSTSSSCCAASTPSGTRAGWDANTIPGVIRSKA